MTVGGAASTGDPFSAMAAQPMVFILAGVGLAAVSLFDAFTVPALHDDLAATGPGLVVVAAMTALGGDLLNLVGRLFQVAGAVAGSRRLVYLYAAFDLADTILNTAGFLLVAASFTSFGALFWRIDRRLAVVGLACGAFTLLAQFPGLGGLLAVASTGYLLWYAFLALRYAKASR